MRCPIGTGQGPEILLAYSSGELNAETAAAFGEHLRGCAACREQAAAQLAVWNALDGWEAPAISADFDRRLFSRIERESSWWHGLMRPMLLRQGVPIAAAAAVIIAAVLIGRPAVAPVRAVPQSAVVDTVAPEQAEHTLQDMETLREFTRLMHAEAADPKM
jgi:anti-sigma factor RsiW